MKKKTVGMIKVPAVFLYYRNSFLCKRADYIVNSVKKMSQSGFPLFFIKKSDNNEYVMITIATLRQNKDIFCILHNRRRRFENLNGQGKS